MHLAFANDLMIFTNKASSSIRAVCDVLDRFYKLSGLKLNGSKTECLCLGISKNQVKEIKEISSFKRGQLPVYYLRVPLISTKLRATCCTSQIERMVAKVRSWASKSLSFARRLQLISSALHNMTTYWLDISFCLKVLSRKSNRYVAPSFGKAMKQTLRSES